MPEPRQGQEDEFFLSQDCVERTTTISASLLLSSTTIIDHFSHYRLRRQIISLPRNNYREHQHVLETGSGEKITARGWLRECHFTTPVVGLNNKYTHGNQRQLGSRPRSQPSQYYSFSQEENGGIFEEDQPTV